MLGATRNPNLTPVDHVFREIAHDIGRPQGFEATDVAVYFGQPGKTVADPYFGGKGPPRTGCISCGGCLVGCRFGAKNTLDMNYLYLAEHLGLSVCTESEVVHVAPLPGGAPGASGYRVETLEGLGPGRRHSQAYEAQQVIFAGGVMGTVDLL